MKVEKSASVYHVMVTAPSGSVRLAVINEATLIELMTSIMVERKKAVKMGLKKNFTKTVYFIMGPTPKGWGLVLKTPYLNLGNIHTTSYPKPSSTDLYAYAKLLLSKLTGDTNFPPLTVPNYANLNDAIANLNDAIAAYLKSIH